MLPVTGNVTGKTTDVPVASEKDITVNELPSAKEKEIGFQKGSQIEVSNFILLCFLSIYLCVLVILICCLVIYGRCLLMRLATEEFGFMLQF